jgi:hypothetical protein
MTTHSGTVTRAWTTTPPPPGRRCLPVCAVAERAVGGAALAANDEARQRRDELRSLLGPALARDVADPVAKRQQLVIRHVLKCRRPVVVVVALLVSDVLRDLPHLLQRGHVRAHSLRQLLAHESCSNRCDAIHGSIVATSTVKRSPYHVHPAVADSTHRSRRLQRQPVPPARTSALRASSPAAAAGSTPSTARAITSHRVIACTRSLRRR